MLQLKNISYSNIYEIVLLSLSQHYISLQTFHIICSSWTWFLLTNIYLNKIHYAE